MIVYILNKRIAAVQLYNVQFVLIYKFELKYQSNTHFHSIKNFGFLYIYEFCLILQLATTCMTDAECGSGECCFRHEGPLIMSRRQLTASLLASNHGNVWNATAFHHFVFTVVVNTVTIFIPCTCVGVCEKYQLEGDHCSVFDKLNGHCSCGAGLKCAFVPDSTTPTTGKRSMVYHSVPGSYRCTPSVWEMRTCNDNQ